MQLIKKKRRIDARRIDGIGTAARAETPDVEERRERMLRAERERLEAILKKNSQRDSKLDARNANRPKIAFGSHVPRADEDRGRRTRRKSWEHPITGTHACCIEEYILSKQRAVSAHPCVRARPSAAMATSSASAGTENQGAKSETSLSPPMSKRMSQSVSVLSHRRRNLVDTSMSSTSTSPGSQKALRRIPETKPRRSSPSTPALGPSTKALDISNRLYKSATQSTVARLHGDTPDSDSSSAAATTVTKREGAATRKPRPHSMTGSMTASMMEPRMRAKQPREGRTAGRASDAGGATAAGAAEASKTRSQSAEGRKKLRQESNLMQQSMYGTLDERQTAVQRRAAAREAGKARTPRAVSAPPRPLKKKPPKEKPASEKAEREKPEVKPPVMKRVPKRPISEKSSAPTPTAIKAPSPAPGKVTSPTPPAAASTPTADAEPTEGIASKSRITSEEEAKAKLAEKRRQAREEAERQAELERQRKEEEARLEAERLKREEEERMLWEEEQHRLAEEGRKAEEERLRRAIEAEENRKEEERLREEEEARLKLEAEQKAQEEREKMQQEMEERARREEDERQQRKKRLEAIMSRTRKTPSTTPVKKDEQEEEAESEKAEEENKEAENVNVQLTLQPVNTEPEAAIEIPAVVATQPEDVMEPALTPEPAESLGGATNVEQDTASDAARSPALLSPTPTPESEDSATEERTTDSASPVEGVADSGVWTKSQDIMMMSMYQESGTFDMTQSMMDSGIRGGIPEENGQDYENGSEDISEKHDYATIREGRHRCAPCCRRSTEIRRLLRVPPRAPAPSINPFERPRIAQHTSTTVRRQWRPSRTRKPVMPTTSVAW
ncbi:PREDICTED: ensconsin-like [Priapulus caudatus]|uniref:Ensconsin-like n=1 Tax=Priapulus caudatus TaxID=37621 RepID=A0ABM1EWD0_PRICU|nr:PREDICTED: ensconsin-like [Priapulus caudatus]